MIAAQYEIVLPTDYDMQIIYRRVAERGSIFDDRAGLGLKAYLVRDVQDGALSNAYAPFYLWNDPGAMAAFHWEGQGFSGIVRDFGRPSVRIWIGGGYYPGTEIAVAPTHAVTRFVTLPAGSDPSTEAEAVTELAKSRRQMHGTHSVAWGIDTSRWEAVIFQLATAPPPLQAGDTLYRVAHLSSPEIETIR